MHVGGSISSKKFSVLAPSAWRLVEGEQLECRPCLAVKRQAFVGQVLRPAQTIESLRNGWRVGVGKKVARGGRAEEQPIGEIGRVFHAEGAGDGIAQREGHVRPAEPGDESSRILPSVAFRNASFGLAGMPGKATFVRFF
jgi:hypothetical protein